MSEAGREAAIARVREAFEAAARLHEDMAAASAAAVVTAADAIAGALGAGHKVLVFGNGGSAAEAQHFAAELVGRFERERPAWPVIALSTDTSALTAIGNDYGFDRVFARQVEALGRPGDVVLALSTSGSSPNVLEGLRAARVRGLVTIGLTGRDGGAMAGACDIHVHVPHRVTARIQEAQLTVLHAICALVETRLGEGAGASAG